VIIRHEASGEAVGFADATIRERHGIAEFECYIDPVWRRRGVVAAIAQVIRHLFTNWPIRKLYCQTFAYNDDSTRILSRIGFAEVGRFREFIWRDDRYWDLVVFCLDRATRQAAVAGEGALGRVRGRLVRSGRLPHPRFPPEADSRARPSP
jgi:RimJ/RimL family protein N-acetyltransferase